MIRLANPAIVLLLGTILMLQGISNAFAASSLNSSRSRACCQSICNSRPCASSADCAKPAEEGSRAPLAPAPSNSQNEWQDMGPLFSVILNVLALEREPIPSRFSSNDAQTAV